jgi:hypothetical protein
VTIVTVYSTVFTLDISTNPIGYATVILFYTPQHH